MNVKWIVRIILLVLLLLVEISAEVVGVDPAGARSKLATMIAAGESGLLIERR